jgi:oxygen-dependent protoporphyrinogen oxidase
VLRPELLELEDDALERRVRDNLGDILGINGSPQTALVTRHWKAMPQYEIGYLSLVKSIEEEVRRFPGLALAGNAYHGVGIPDCIHSGELAAESIAPSLERSHLAQGYRSMAEEDQATAEGGLAAFRETLE